MNSSISESVCDSVALSQLQDPVSNIGEYFPRLDSRKNVGWELDSSAFKLVSRRSK